MGYRAVADGGAQVPGHHQKKVEQLWAPPKNSQIRTKNYKCPNIYIFKIQCILKQKLFINLNSQIILPYYLHFDRKYQV